MTESRRRARRAVEAPPPVGDFGARTRILQGAALVFANVGVRAASVEDVLKASGVSRRTFYSFYENKESVMVALYRMGTDALLGACAVAVGEGKTPLARVSGCIDAHLRNAREFGRIVFVLGGEAHRQESLLHARRREVHDALVSLFATATTKPGEQPRDPLLYRALVLAVEGVTRMALEEGDEGRAVTTESIERARRVMLHIVGSALELSE